MRDHKSQPDNTGSRYADAGEALFCLEQCFRPTKIFVMFSLACLLRFKKEKEKRNHSQFDNLTTALLYILHMAWRHH